MIKAILSDFSRVILLPRTDGYQHTLSYLYKEAREQNKEDFSFGSYFKLNKELLEFYSQLKDSLGVGLYILTNSKMLKEAAVKDQLEPLFSRIFISDELGLVKGGPATYGVVAGFIGLPTEEILFIDDQEGNIEAAGETGMPTILYKGNKVLKKELERIFGQRF